MMKTSERGCEIRMRCQPRKKTHLTTTTELKDESVDVSKHCEWQGKGFNEHKKMIFSHLFASLVQTILTSSTGRTSSSRKSATIQVPPRLQWRAS
jgi:hypothetical protein